MFQSLPTFELAAVLVSTLRFSIVLVIYIGILMSLRRLRVLAEKGSTVEKLLTALIMQAFIVAANSFSWLLFTILLPYTMPESLQASPVYNYTVLTIFFALGLAFCFFGLRVIKTLGGKL
jgi:hypothetical protein